MKKLLYLIALFLCALSSGSYATTKNLPLQWSCQSPNSLPTLNGERTIVGEYKGYLVANLVMDIPDNYTRYGLVLLIDEDKDRYLIVQDKFQNKWLDAKKTITEQLSTQEIKQLQNISSYAYSVGDNQIFGLLNEVKQDGDNEIPTRAGPGYYSVDIGSTTCTWIRLETPDKESMTQGIVLRASSDGACAFGVYFEDSREVGQDQGYTQREHRWVSSPHQKELEECKDQQREIQKKFFFTSSPPHKYAIWVRGDKKTYKSLPVSFGEEDDANLAAGKISYFIAAASDNLSTIGVNRVDIQGFSTLVSITAGIITHDSDSTKFSHMPMTDDYQLVSMTSDGKQVLMYSQNSLLELDVMLVEPDFNDTSVFLGPPGTAQSRGMEWLTPTHTTTQYPAEYSYTTQHLSPGKSVYNGYTTAHAIESANVTYNVTALGVDFENLSGFYSFPKLLAQAQHPTERSFDPLNGPIPVIEYKREDDENFTLYSPYIESFDRSTASYSVITLPKITHLPAVPVRASSWNETTELVNMARQIQTLGLGEGATRIPYKDATTTASTTFVHVLPLVPARTARQARGPSSFLKSLCCGCLTYSGKSQHK